MTSSSDVFRVFYAGLLLHPRHIRSSLASGKDTCGQGGTKIMLVAKVESNSGDRTVFFFSRSY